MTERHSILGAARSPHLAQQAAALAAELARGVGPLRGRHEVGVGAAGAGAAHEAEAAHQALDLAQLTLLEGAEVRARVRQRRAGACAHGRWTDPASGVMSGYIIKSVWRCCTTGT